MSIRIWGFVQVVETESENDLLRPRKIKIERIDWYVYFD